MIKGLPIEEIRLAKLYGTDLSVLETLPLKRITLAYLNKTKLDSLRGSKRLEEVNIEGGFTDISGLEGIATLQNVYVDRCRDLKDIRPVLTLPRLSRLVLPRSVTDLEFLRGKPGLTELSYGSNQSAENFWQDYDANR